MTASTATPTYPEYHSIEYFDVLARRAARNFEFRQRCDKWNRLPLAVKRARAAEILADLP